MRGLVKWRVYFPLFLFIGLSPLPLMAANWNVDVGPTNHYFTRSSLNPTDIGTENITISVGDTITWTWLDGATPHGVTTTDGAGVGVPCINGSSVAFDTSYQAEPFTFTSPVFNTATPAGSPCKYYCIVHASPSALPPGMVGFITVQTGPLTVNKAGTGTGTVTSSPAGINCGTTCSATFTAGTSVTLTAVPDASSTFGGFSGGCVSSTTTCSATIPVSSAVTATFNGTGGATGPAGLGYNTEGFFDAGSSPDFVTASGDNKKISLYPITSAGALLGGNPPAPTFTMTDPNTPQGLAAGSFNNNTDLFDDLVVLDRLSDGTTIFSLYYGNKAGSLPKDASGVGTPSAQFYVPKSGSSSPDTIVSVSAKDVNGDGKTDLLITLAPATSGGDLVPKILLGNGDGTFGGAAPWPIVQAVASVTVSPATVSLIVGSTRQFSATAFDALGNPINGASFSWSSGNPAVCSVTATGLVTAVGVGGPVNITATSSNGITGTGACTATPVVADVSALSISATLSGSNLIISSTIFNSGKSVLNTVNIGLYLSADNIIDLTDTLIGSRTAHFISVNGVSTATNTISLQNIPTGTYYVGMYANYDNLFAETNYANNTLATSNTFLIGPDLTPLSLSATASGLSIYVTDTEQNIGSQPAGSFTVSYYFSKTTSPNPATDTLIGTRNLAGLAAGGTSTATLNFPIPTSLSVGSYYVCAITNSGNTVVEINTTNNTTCTTGTYPVGPDLLPVSLTATKSQKSIIVSDTEQNTGNQAAGSFTVSFYVSTIPTYDNTAILLGTRTVAGLAGGNATNSSTGTYAVPKGIVSGNYYVLAVADSGNVIAETNKTNNTLATTGTISLP